MAMSCQIRQAHSATGERSYLLEGGVCSVQSTRIRESTSEVTHYLGNFLLEEDRQIERTAKTEAMPAHALRIWQGHVGEALE